MKKLTNLSPISIASNYHRGWEQSQQELQRQERLAKQRLARKRPLKPFILNTVPQS